ncbi:MAG: cytochrome c [Thermodesulfobacteriota bacterium]
MKHILIVIIGIAILMGSTMSGNLAQAGEGSVEKGKELYGAKKCGLCHTVDGSGGKKGGDLSDVGDKRDAEWLTKYMKDPKSLLPEAKMPAFKGSDEELQDLVAYLLSLKKAN